MAKPMRMLEVVFTENTDQCTSDLGRIQDMAHLRDTRQDVVTGVRLVINDLVQLFIDPVVQTFGHLRSKHQIPGHEEFLHLFVGQ